VISLMVYRLQLYKGKISSAEAIEGPDASPVSRARTIILENLTRGLSSGIWNVEAVIPGSGGARSLQSGHKLVKIWLKKKVFEAEYWTTSRRNLEKYR
jgi:hypothetical protein